MAAPAGDQVFLVVGSTSLLDHLDLNDGSHSLLVPGSLNAPPPVHRPFRSRTRQTEIKLDPNRTVDFEVILTAADPVILWANYHAIEAKLLEANLAWLPDGPTETVCLWVKPVGASSFVYFDVYDGQVTVLAEDHGGAPFIRVHVSLLCLPWLRGDPIPLGPFNLTNANPHVFIQGLAGDTEGPLHLQMTDTTSGEVIQSFRMAQAQGKDLVSTDTPFVLPVNADVTPGNITSSPFFFGTKHTGDTTAVNSTYVRKTVGATWQPLACFQVDWGNGTPPKWEGDVDLFLRVRSPASGGSGPTTPLADLAVASPASNGSGAITGQSLYVVVTPAGPSGVEFPFYTAVLAEPAQTGGTQYYFTFTAVPGATIYRAYAYLGATGSQSTAIWTVFYLTFDAINSRWVLNTASPYNRLQFTDPQFPQVSGGAGTVATASYKALLRARAGLAATFAYSNTVVLANPATMNCSPEVILNTPTTDWHFVYLATCPLPPVPALEDGTVPPWLVIVEAESQVVNGQQVDADSLWCLPHLEPQAYAAWPTHDLTQQGVWQWGATTEGRAVASIVDPATGALIAAVTPLQAPLLGRPNVDLLFMATVTNDVASLAAAWTVSGFYVPRYWYFRGTA